MATQSLLGAANAIGFDACIIRRQLCSFGQRDFFNLSSVPYVIDVPPWAEKNEDAVELKNRRKKVISHPDRYFVLRRMERTKISSNSKLKQKRSSVSRLLLRPLVINRVILLVSAIKLARYRFRINKQPR